MFSEIVAKTVTHTMVKQSEEVNKAKLMLEKFRMSNKSKTNKVFIFANGGSAGIAEHIGIDFTKTCGIPALTMHGPSVISCLANDYGFEHWVSKALEFYATPNDMAIFISSSGNSKNIVNGVKAANSRGLDYFSLTGFDELNTVRLESKLDFYVNSTNYNVVETSHNIILLEIIERLNGLNGL